MGRSIHRIGILQESHGVLIQIAEGVMS